ncbi:MAG: type II and III secretion system protein family protein [Pseudomonadota bacterium]
MIAAAIFAGGPTERALAQADNNILRIARGATSSDVNVNVNRAIVLESAQRFAEVSVANPDIADVAALSDQTIYILGKTPGTTTLTLLGEAGRLITNVDVSVTADLAEFKQRLREVLPNEEIDVRSAAGGVILSGVVSGARKIDTAVNLAELYAPERVTNLLSVGGTQQVMLKIRFAEVQRSASKALGFNISALSGQRSLGGNSSVSSTLGTGISTARQTVNEDGVPNLPAIPVPGNFGIGQVALSVGGAFIEVIFSALEQKGVVRTLAEPNLVALSGDTAQFLAGGEVPIPIADEEGISVTFKPFGIGLAFTPTVVDDDLINLELETEVSSLDSSVQVTTAGISLSGFTVRRARTTVELKDGQSMAIAGLLQDDFVDAKTQLPWLGDIPVLGTLFRSSDFQRNQTELVIIITPTLVTPVDGDQLSLPTDRMRIPNESELFLLGKVEGDPLASEVASQDLDGTYGYILE